MKTTTPIAFASLIILLSGCITFVSQTLPSSLSEKGKKVSVNESDVTFLNLAKPDFYGNEILFSRLAQACPEGRVEAISSTFAKREFLVVQVYEFTARGNCVSK